MKKLTSWVTIAVCLPDGGTLTVLGRKACSQYKQIVNKQYSGEDLTTPVENPLKICISCGNIQIIRTCSFCPSLFLHLLDADHRSVLEETERNNKSNLKRAQNVTSLMPVTYKDPADLKDPKLCSIKYWK
jgi:small subunit ribosomal protein S18